MANVLLLLVPLLLTFLAQGSAQSSCIQTNIWSTGSRKGLDMEFTVEIKNSCICAQRGVRVNAPGFASQSPIDPMIFRRDADAFLVNGGNPIAGGAAVRFTYWWDHATRFSPVGSLPAC